MKLTSHLAQKLKNNLNLNFFGTWSGTITLVDLTKQATQKCNKHKKRIEEKGEHV
jgi:hypothetical protein